MSSQHAFVAAASSYYRGRAAAAEMAIRHARGRAPVAHKLLDVIWGVLIDRPIINKMLRSEVQELEGYALRCADCGVFASAGDISTFTDRSIRGRLAMILTAAAKR